MTDSFDPNAMLAQVQEMQQRLLDAQAASAEQVVEGTAGGGKVTVAMTGLGEFTSVRIDPSVVDPAEVDLLEDLILAAIHDASTKAAEANADSLGGLGLGGFGGLGGLLGG